jgi:hypothetical protein
MSGFEEIDSCGGSTSKCLCLLVTAWLIVSFEALAWSSAGHMVIAAEAWNELPPAVKARATELLKSHPEYQKWADSFHGEARGLDLDEFVFLRASVWPDEIRRHGKQYDHSHWHYINYPLRPPSFSMEPPPASDDDILFGIEQSEKTLSDPKLSPEERAVSLSWLIHLIGDLHQPLHCVSLFNETHPHGDKGGNDFFVKPASRSIKLHSLWDGLLGTSAKAQPQINYASQIQHEHPRRLKELKSNTTPRQWSLEGRAWRLKECICGVA